MRQPSDPLTGDRKMSLSNIWQTPRRTGRVILLAMSLAPVLAMKAGLAQDRPPIPLPAPDDWTHRHVVFSGARTAAAAQSIASDPRYLNQWLRQNHPVNVAGASGAR